MQDESYARNAAATNEAASLGAKSHEDFPVNKSLGNWFRNWRALFFAAMLGVVCGVAVYFSVPPKWQATVIVRVGKAMDGAPSDRVLTDQMAQTVQWLRSKEFADALVASMDQPETAAGEGETADVKLFRSSLKAREIAGSQLLRVDYLGYSLEQLQKYVDAIKQEVLVSHNNVLNAQRAELNVAREKIEKELAASESEYQHLRMEYGRIQSQPEESQLSYASALAAQIERKGVLAESLRKTQRELDRRAFSAHLYPAVVTQAEVYQKPVFPKIPGFLIGGFVGGFFCGLIYLIARRRIRFSLMS